MPVPKGPTALLSVRVAKGGEASLGDRTRHLVKRKRSLMSLGTIMLVILFLLLLGVLPTWGHSRNWGYGPSGGLGLLLVIVLVLVFTGRI